MHYQDVPGPGGGFSPRTVGYDDTAIALAANSINQAYALAHKKVWASDPDKPLGILWVYRRDQRRRPRACEAIWRYRRVVAH